METNLTTFIIFCLVSILTLFIASQIISKTVDKIRGITIEDFEKFKDIANNNHKRSVENETRSLENQKLIQEIKKALENNDSIKLSKKQKNLLLG
jgi:hypothetical protein